MKSICLLFLVAFSSFCLYGQPTTASVIRFNETYELANIVLALTEYGKADRNEVNKTTAYYQEVMRHFGPYADHPLVGQVNYSRALWDKLLSFRTDAVAFEFDEKGQLLRKHKFYAMGKQINEFEEHLELIEDFAQKTAFRQFYASKTAYFDSLAMLYEQSLMVNEIKAFLSQTFEEHSVSKYQILVSPLVGRMHCQRTFNGYSTSFINIPDYVFNAKALKDIDQRSIASGLHMFFTEIDHDYVNPTTQKHKKAYKKSFVPTKWDKGSGYEKYKYATFNEYMTWAVYDVFVTIHFPTIAPEVIREWHEVNEGRGFFVSRAFGQKVTDLYKSKLPDETLADLYPKILAWCAEVGDHTGTLIQAQQ